MIRRHGWQVLIGGLIVVAAGCRSAPGPVAPDPAASLTGTWSGTATDSEAGEGTVQWVVTHSSAGLSGSFTTVFEEPAFSATGTLAGVVTGAAGSVFLMPAEPLRCSPAFSTTGTIYVSLAIGADRLTGSYSTFTCVGGRAGTLVLNRQ